MEHVGKAAERALRGSVKGRKDAQKQEKVIDLKIIKDRLGELKSLKAATKSASVAYGEAIKKAAQDSGLNSSAVRRFVDAAAGDNIDERKRDAEQLSLLFDEVKV
jgi:hypothetical protein